jgi:hypothetical protein
MGGGGGDDKSWLLIHEWEDEDGIFPFLPRSLSAAAAAAAAYKKINPFFRASQNQATFPAAPTNNAAILTLGCLASYILKFGIPSENLIVVLLVRNPYLLVSISHA